MSELQSALRESVEFQNPEYLTFVPIAGLLLLIGMAVFVLRLRLRPPRTHGSSYPLFGHVKFWFFAVLALGVLSVAAARPFWVYGGSSFKRGDVDVAVIVDASASMWVRDLGPSRLEIAVREALGLYTEDILTPGDRVALFVFGTTALRQVHLSSNAERFVEQVGQIAPPEQLSGDAFPWDSDIAAAFEHVYQSLDNQDRFDSGDDDWQPARRSDRAVLLFTDGDFAADNEQVARLDLALSEFARRGLVVYPVVIGTRTGVDVDVVLQDYVRGIDFDETLEADLDGIRTRVDPEGVAMFDQRSGGGSFVLENVGLSAASFLRNAIDSHRSVTFQLVPSEDQQEIWQWFVILAILVVVVAMLFY